MTRPPPRAPSLESIDLNLLVAFEALWSERGVTSAGRRLGLSQPTMSGVLARLRAAFDDPLFVRSGRGLTPTERCTELAGPVQRALTELRNALATTAFDPRTARREVRLGVVDPALGVVLPRLCERVMAEAPHVTLRALAIEPIRATQLLDDGQFDLALSPMVLPSATVRSRPLYRVDFVVAVRRDHPLAGRRSEPRRLDGFPRVHVRFEGMPVVPAAVVLGSFLAVPPVLMRCDAWALLPGPLVRPLVDAGQLALVETTPPGVPTDVVMRVAWPDAQHDAPLSRWLRGLLAEVVRDHAPETDAIAET